MSTRERITFGIALALASACASCGGPEGYHPVRGKVTYKGQPAAGAAVFFHKEGAKGPNDPILTGVADEDGVFGLASDRGLGAPEGKYAVLVEWRDETPGAEAPSEAPTPKQTKSISPRKGQGRPGVPVKRARSKDAELAPDRLRGRYADRTSPRFFAEVKPGTNELAPFDLTD
jgi:hypothetical protein